MIFIGGKSGKKIDGKIELKIVKRYLKFFSLRVISSSAEFYELGPML
jgi:hypothetical protein